MPRRVQARLGFAGKIEERTLLVPDREPAPYGPGDPLRVVSTRAPRVEAPDKVRGTARYTADVRLPGMLHGRILRSPHPAARVASIDLAAAPVKRGDVAQGLREAELTLERTYRTRCQTHAPLETHGVVAVWEGEELTLYASTHGIFAVRDGVAQTLGIAPEKVRVLTEHMGGGFGSKLGPTPEAAIAARLAREAGAPVRLMLSRAEDHLCAGNRPDSVQRLRVGAKRDGRFTALHLVSHGTGGVAGGAGTGGPARAIYVIPNLLIEHTDVFTHLGPARPFRAPGHPQGAFALEQMLDELAAGVGLDPLEMRLRNLADPIREAQLRLAAERFGWKDREARRQAAAPWRRGFGLASAVWYQTGRPGMRVELEVGRDGKVVLRSGSQDIGTGLRTVLGMVVAEELGLEVRDVTIRLGDTRLPLGPASGGSNTTSSLAPTTRVAAVQDCGLPLNRLTAENQILGGVIQGISYALLEERVVDHRFGVMLNANVEQYKIAGSLDLPEIEPILFDVYLGSNATGTIGIGEPPTIPTAAAVANAVADALGVRIYELPMTPARVLAALARKGESP
jgi:CO/xanthine dehydrogenase Mo-binding subunit